VHYELIGCESDKAQLAVDYEVELLELAKESLEILGYRVLTASNGKEALERLAEHPTISLLFSDIVMPGGMNGYELMEQAMEYRSDLKVLLTTSIPWQSTPLLPLKSHAPSSPWLVRA